MMRRFFRANWFTLLCVAFLFALPFVLFAPVTLGGKTLLPADILYQYEPFKQLAGQFGITRPQNDLLADLVLENYEWKKFAIDSLRAGELPLWNPNLFAGVPFLAAGQHSMLYPLSILYLIMPLAKAYGWFTVLNLAIAGLNMFIFMRTLKLGRGAALIAAVIYELSGFMIVSVVFQMVIASAAWMPLILAMCERIIRRNRTLSSVIIGAAAIAMNILAGHVEITIYTAMVAALFCIWRIASNREGALKKSGWLLAMALLGGALGAIQIVPLFELVTRNFRSSGHSTLEQVMSYGFAPREVLNFLMPNFFGNPATHAYFDLFSGSWQAVQTASGNTHWGVKNYVEGGAYMSVFALLLAGIAVISAIRPVRSARPHRSERRFPTFFFVILAIFSVLFIFGTRAYALLFALPGFSQLHSPFRWLYPLTLCVAALAGAGWQIVQTTPRSRLVRVMAFVAGAFGAVLLMALVAARLAWPMAEKLVGAALARLLYADKAFTSPEMFFSYEAVNIGLFALMLLASAGILVWVNRRGAAVPRPYIASAIAAILIAADLSIAWTGFNPAQDPKLLEATPDAVAFLKKDTSQWRMTSFTPDGSRPFHANTPWLFNMQDVRGYDSIIPKQYVDYAKLIEPQVELEYNRVGPLYKYESLDSPLLDLLGVKYIASQVEIKTPGYTQVYTSGELRIYQNTRALPRAFTLPQTSALLTNDFAGRVQTDNPTQYVMIDANCGISDAGCVIPRPAQAKAATITSYKNNEVWVDVAIDEPSWLMLTDSYFPGWRAWVRPLGGADADEKEAQIGLANGNFRAVRLDMPTTSTITQTQPAPFGGAAPGLGAKPAEAPSAQTAKTAAYTVRFKYSPDSVRIGGLASLVGFAALALLGVVAVWRRAQKPSASAEAHGEGVRRVARNSLVLTAVNIGSRLIDFAFATLMLRVLGPSGAGDYAFAVVIVSWFEIFMNFGLNTYLTREVAQDKTHSEAHLFNTSGLRMGLALAALPVVLLVILVSGGGQVGLAILLLTLSQLPGSLSTGISALFFAHERAEIPAAFTLVTALLKVALGTLALLSGLGIVGLALTSIAVNLITLVLLAMAARSALGVRFLRGFAKEPNGAAKGPVRSRMDTLREAFPLMLNHLLATLFFKVDVPLLRGLQGASVVGWYSTAYKFVDAFNIIPAFFTQSLFPALSRMAANRQPRRLGDDASASQNSITQPARFDKQDDPFARAFTLAVKLLVMVAVPVAVATTFAAHWMVDVLGGKEFLPQGQIALMLMIWSIPFGWVNSVTNYALIAVGQQRALTRAFIIGLVFNVVANLIFIPLFSFQAAAVITILSELVEGAAFYFYVRRHITRLNWADVFARPALAGLVMAAVCAALNAINLLGVGVALGGLAYVAALAFTRALNADERAVLAPLLPSRARGLLAGRSA